MTFVPNEAQLKVAGRIKRRRNELGLTQKEVAERINERNTNPEIRDIAPFTVANWERGHTPRPAMLALLADVLNLSPAYLMSMSNSEGEQDKRVRDILQQIDIDDLPRHGGEAVWIRPFDSRLPEYVALVSNIYDYVIRSDEQHIPFSNIQGTVWTLPMAADQTILSLDDAKRLGRAFMDPIRTPREVRMKLGGWYKYDPKSDLFIKEDGAYAFPSSHYLKMFIGREKAPTRF